MKLTLCHLNEILISLFSHMLHAYVLRYLDRDEMIVTESYFYKLISV